MANILIIDDERPYCDLLTRTIAKVGHHSSFALTLADGLKDVYENGYELVLLDVQLPDGNGLSAIGKIKGAPCAPEVIILTGSGNPDGAESAIRWGAWDYIEKPASTKEIMLPVMRALEFREEKCARNSTVALDRKGIMGDSTPMKACIDQLAQACRSDANVLITGETGTGKELFARALHANSSRRNKPFVVVDCAALPENIVESLLFGHEKGAFTGADSSRTGLIKQAHGGTLFLDEVGELPQSLQKAFLRVLQEHRFRPVGSKTEETSDFRLLAATNRDLDHMVESKSFRNDLLFRIRSFAIELPPLRDRLQDIRQLTLYYVSEACGKARIMMKGFSPDFFDVLEKYEWPGNVRELFGTLQSALISAFDDPILYPLHLPVEIRARAARLSVAGKPFHWGEKEKTAKEQLQDDKTILPYTQFRTILLENGERDYFRTIVASCEGNIAKACQMSGLSRSRFYHFLQKHEISLSRSTNPHE